MNLIEKECLLCGPEANLSELYEQTFKEADLTPAVFSARRVTEHFHYRMVKCDCGLVFSREVLPDEKAWELYSNSQFNFGEYTMVLRQDYWRHIKKSLGDVSQKSALEVGCSNGFFLEELKAQGFASVTGCEPSRHAKEAAHPSVRDQILLEAFHGAKTFPDKKFDLVCVFHTLDHLSDPAAFLAHCREVLKPGGLVYVVVHNVDALQARLLGERSPIIDVEHIYLFNLKTLSQTLIRTGLEPLKVGHFWNSYPLGYWLRMFPMKEKTKQRIAKFMKAIGLHGLRVPLSAGNIFAVATLKK